MSVGKWAGVVALICLAGCGKFGNKPTVVTPVQAKSEKRARPFGEIKPTDRIRPECPIRIGGLYLMGLGEGEGDFAESATNGVKLSEANREWLAAHCDMVALSPNTLTPDTFPKLRRQQTLFTPLLYLYASTLYEQPDYKGNVGGWKPEMSAWTLRDATGGEVKHPDAGGHWMDLGSKDWAAHWRTRTEALCGQFGAYGAIAAEMPQANLVGREELGKYKTDADRGEAAEAWLRKALDTSKYMLLPSATGFDSITGHTTPVMLPGTSEPELSGRYWDQFYALTDGAWNEGWIHPYWSEQPLPDSYWELHLEAADRAARNDKVFLVTAAYRNDTELEYALASYLLIAKRQSRLFFQPMPLRPNQPENAGMSLAVLKRELEEKAAYFDAPLGLALQERHPLTLDDGVVWRRAYQFGDVYVNSDNTHSVTVTLGNKMLRVNGQIVHSFVLAPHEGAILRYIAVDKASDKKSSKK